MRIVSKRFSNTTKKRRAALTAISDSLALGNGANQPIFAEDCSPGEGNGVADGDVLADAEGKKLNSADDRARVIVGRWGVGWASKCVGFFAAAAAAARSCCVRAST